MIPYLVRPGRVSALMQKMDSWPAVCLDCETTGLNVYAGDKPLGFGVSNLYPDGEEASYYLPIDHLDADNLSREEASQLQGVMNGKPLLGYNLKFDLHAGRDVLGHFPDSPLYDTIIGARIVSEEDRPALDLDSVAYRYAGFKYRSEAAGHESEFGKVDKAGRPKWSVEQIGHKCCEDVQATRLSYLAIKEKLDSPLSRLFATECKLTRKLFEIEARGVKYNPDTVVALNDQLDSLKEGLKSELRQDTGLEDFNPNSHPQVSNVLARRGHAPRAVSEKTGDPSWKREHLVATGDPFALEVAKYRALGHEQSNLLAALFDLMKQGEPFYHPIYKNWGTVTGRLSSPAQSIAKGYLQLGELGEGDEPLCWSEEGPDFSIALRRIFVPREKMAFVVADYRQIEMFVAGWYMQDSAFLELLNPEDFHAATAEKVWGVVNSDTRKRAKWFNFGLLYGLGLKSLAGNLHCSEEEAAVYRDDYFEIIGPAYWRVQKAIRSLLEERGWMENVYRRRYWGVPDMAYILWNYMVQGSAGDFVKFRQFALEDPCRGLGAWVDFTTHDDITFEVPRENLGGMGRLLDCLSDGVPFGMTLPLDVKIGQDNWVDMKKLEECIAT